MKNNSKANLQSIQHIDKQLTFDIKAYKFFSSTLYTKYEYIKTQIDYKLTQQQIKAITKIHHQNIISLRKISKYHKNKHQQIFWLYYQIVGYSLQDIVHFINFNISPQTLQKILANIKNYCIHQNIYPDISKYNIGVSEGGIIKVYLPINQILKKTIIQVSEMDKKIKQIVNWYTKLFNRKSIKTKLHKSQSDNQIIMCNFNKINKINNRQIINKIKYFTQCANNNHQSINKYQQNKKQNKKQTNQKISQKITQKQLQHHKCQQIHINAYTKNNQLPTPNLPPNKHKISLQNMIKPPKIIKDDDNQSIDTYQMQMGQDFEMPSIRTNQKLRQTLIDHKQSWDTLTHKVNIIKPQMDIKIYESAGQKQFIKLINKNKRQQKQQKIKCSFDSKTIQDKIFYKNWQTSTIKSTIPSNIQNKVQEALTRTKNAMEMLKRAKSTSLIK